MLKIIVTVKQVPDTSNVTGEAMRPDGTVNRAMLPAVFNPDDMHALEEALKIKEQLILSGQTPVQVVAITMGPPKAKEVLKECLYRGADEVVLISDSRFAGADTLATSYALKCAILKLAPFDLVICGRQAIDGDTAQVGPQLAEKLDINQLTCVHEVIAVDTNNKKIKVKRFTDNGYEILASKFPVLLTVTAGDTNTPRPPSVKKVIEYKKIPNIKEWNVETIAAVSDKCGLSGSPTKVKEIRNVVLTTSNFKEVPNHDEGIRDLIKELIAEHILS